MNNTKSGWDRLSADYNKGYTKAIKDIIDIFSYVNEDILDGKGLKPINKKETKS